MHLTSLLSPNGGTINISIYFPHQSAYAVEECEYAVDSAKVKKFVSAIMTTQQCWANFGNAYYKPLQLKEFGPKGADSGVVTVLVIFFLCNLDVF